MHPELGTKGSLGKVPGSLLKEPLRLIQGRFRVGRREVYDRIDRNHMGVSVTWWSHVGLLLEEILVFGSTLILDNSHLGIET